MAEAASLLVQRLQQEQADSHQAAGSHIETSQAHKSI
jgi:hypothetical protein